eukprot:Gb_13765 [translate_table: standard]
MKGGSGDSSYAHNSLSVQTKMVEAIKPFLESGIGGNMRVEWLRGLEGGVIRIADLGCATGINTLLAADTIVKSLKQICIRHSIGRVPEFQVYFADLPSNDFNSLFRMLPPHQLSAATGPQYHAYNNGCCLTAAPRPASRSYFAAAVTGSFYRRLFPRQSLHFVHSSISLQWLSRVPESVEDKRCPAWNGGGIFISNEAVAADYHRQFTTDFTAFLQARAEEMLIIWKLHLMTWSHRPKVEGRNCQGHRDRIRNHHFYTLGKGGRQVMGNYDLERWRELSKVTGASLRHAMNHFDLIIPRSGVPKVREREGLPPSSSHVEDICTVHCGVWRKKGRISSERMGGDPITTEPLTI